MDVKIILISSDSKQFSVSHKIATNSGLINMMLESVPEENMELVEIPLPNINSKILKKVIDFLEHFYQSPLEDIPKPIKSGKMIENVKDEWYAKFIDEQSQEDLFELILAANYADINPLLNLGCAKTACLIKGKTPEEIRKTFNIKDDNQEENNNNKIEKVW
jgi:S-phase kinase-associated protein 1